MSCDQNLGQWVFKYKISNQITDNWLLDLNLSNQMPGNDNGFNI